MRYALLSDVHANLPALEAVLEDVAARSDIDAVYHLGDLVGYGPWPNETVAFLRSRGVPGVAGNYDSTVAAGHAHCGCRYDDPREEALSQRSYDWTRRRVSSETRRFLAGLPFRIDIRPRGGHVAGPKIVLVHGSPTLNTLYWTEERPDAFCRKMAEVAGAKEGDVIAFGHTHRGWYRETGGIHFLDCGSAGRPKDGDWRACYALLSVEDGVAVEFVRIAYDLERAVEAIRRSELPDEFGEILRTGGRLPPADGAGGPAGPSAA